MLCKRCLNKDPKYFYKGSKGFYCRKCISFKRLLIEEEIGFPILDEIKDDAYEYLLKYPLSGEQSRISKLCSYYIDNHDVLINAVCGAGKTEIVLESISKYLQRKQRVCIAISRRQVVLELAKRLKEIFIKAKVTAICHGYTDDLTGDLIVCTTHQCYRFYQTFDLLILDEPDAFPFKGNKVLRNIVLTSCKGNIIYLTATLDNYLRRRIKHNDIICLKLNKRPHGYNLIVPKVKIDFTWLLLIYLFNWLIKHKNESNLVFVPSITLGKNLYSLLKLFFKCAFCCSISENKDAIIADFKNRKINLLIATTILERGITIENINVCVFYSDHKVFDEASLIQMSGRVGRSFRYPEGDCLFLSRSKSKEVDKCIGSIVEANK